MLTDEMVKDSLELKWRKRNIKFSLIFIGVLFLVALGCCVINEFPIVFGLCVFLIYFLICGSFVLYEWITCLLIYKQKAEYVIYEVVFGYPEISYLAKGYDYFTVAITKKDGDVVYRKTKPMWSDYFGSKNKTWEYSNEKVTVAYNEQRDKLIVLGKYGFKEGENERNY